MTLLELDEICCVVSPGSHMYTKRSSTKLLVATYDFPEMGYLKGGGHNDFLDKYLAWVVLNFFRIH